MSKPSNQEEPTYAPGMEDDKLLEKKATPEEIAKGDYTTVTKLTYDEVEPSRDE